MAQVLTNDNMQQFIQTGKVDEFKPPEAEAKPQDAKAEPATAEEVKPEPQKADVEDDDGLKPGDEAFNEKVRKRIGEKHRLMREAEEFAEAQFNERRLAEKRLAAVEQENATLKAKAQPQEVAAKEPDVQDFQDMKDYAKALAKWESDKAIREFKAEQAQEQARAKQAAIEAEFGKRLSHTAKEIPDFQETLETFQGSEHDRMHNAVLEAIKESDVPGPLMYHLMKHPEVIDRINSFSPLKAVAEIGKLEASLSKSKEPEKKLTALVEPERSRAPEPIKPLEGKETPVHKDPATMTFQELREYNRQKQATSRPRRQHH